jgi:type II secretory pathway component PulM
MTKGSDTPIVSREILSRHALASYLEGERVVVLGLAPATIQNRLREAREHRLLMGGMLSTLALYGIAALWVGSNKRTQSCRAFLEDAVVSRGDQILESATHAQHVQEIER